MSIKQGLLFVYQICQALLNVLNPPISDGAIQYNQAQHYRQN